MADKVRLTQLATDIQKAVDAYDPKDISSRAKIQAALETMQSMICPPEIVMIEQRFRTLQNVCILAAIEMGLFKSLGENQGKILTARDLAEMSGYDQVFVARVMRMMTAIGWASETGNQTYTANAYTICQTQSGAEGGFIISNEMLFPLAAKMRQYLQQEKPCNMSATTTRPAYDFAMGETVWETLKKNAKWKKGFDDSMTYRNTVVSVPWHVKYPFEHKIIQATSSSSSSSRQAGKKMVIVDIGGSQGVDLDRFASSFPDLECDLVLQDLPETLSQLREKGVRLDTRIRMMEYDFFTAQPLHGADIYYLKSVLHDWDDSSSLKILSNTAKAMTSTSRLLINEMVLSDTNESLLRVEMDMLMLFLCNGMERTRSQWEELLGKVEPPLKIVGVSNVEGDEQSVIEVGLE